MEFYATENQGSTELLFIFSFGHGSFVPLAGNFVCFLFALLLKTSVVAGCGGIELP